MPRYLYTGTGRGQADEIEIIVMPSGAKPKRKMRFQRGTEVYDLTDEEVAAFGLADREGFENVDGLSDEWVIPPEDGLPPEEAE